MKTRFLIKLCLLFILMTGCGGDGGGGFFIPNFSNLWTSSRATTFQFLPSATNVSKGDFIGDEDDVNKFEGTFNSYNVEFTFTEGNEAGVKYSGQFVKDSDPLTMKVKGTNNVELTITKN
ncbi:hypothetical protein GZH53_05305 [Flavihumibacter sp. R14]|nr:hypothetical protein [Flavihumibacter soli]